MGLPRNTAAEKISLYIEVYVYKYERENKDIHIKRLYVLLYLCSVVVVERNQ